MNKKDELKTDQFSKLGFAKTFVIPALWVFLIPVFSLLFFQHAQGRYDSEVKSSILKSIHGAPGMSADERAQQSAYFETPVSELIVLHPTFGEKLPSSLQNDYMMFRYLIRLSVGSIIAGVVVFLLGGGCFLLSLRSQAAQYYSLAIGWNVLRLFSALEAIAQAIMLVALSYWVTALWLNVYIMKLIIMVGVMALIAVGMVLKAIFTFPKSNFEIEGKLLEPSTSAALWERLRHICEKVGTQPPDHVIAGIDTNFFVTETPAVVDKKTYTGRTLFISLALLKQLQSSEADAVLAHEMAHFSGNDTLYSKKIGPLLTRYDIYLAALQTGVLTLPVFYFMVCFRALFQWSLGNVSRQREFRADRIAADTTTPNDLAGALLRISAYSKYRSKVQEELFEQERVLAAANVSEKVEQGFPAFALGFASDPELAEARVGHPFDSHPPLDKRLEALNTPAPAALAPLVLATPGDAGWYHAIDQAAELEGAQWKAFEEAFRAYHEKTLAYRLLPEGPEEIAIVAAAFPEVTLDSKDGPAVINYQKLKLSTPAISIEFREMTKLTMDNNKVLTIGYSRAGHNLTQVVKTKRFTKQAEFLDVLGRYHYRATAAVEYRAGKAGKKGLSR